MRHLKCLKPTLQSGLKSRVFPARELIDEMGRYQGEQHAQQYIHTT